MKLYVNPRYQHLREWLEHIDEHFAGDSPVPGRGAVLVRTVQVDGLTLTVKRFGAPGMAGKIAQRTFRTPKAKKAYVKPFLMRERGFETPEPIAFVRYHRGLLRGDDTYYVALKSDFRYTLDRLGELPQDQQQDVIRAFARFTANLHEQGFLHHNFTSQNILFDQRRERWHFQLIDTHCMRCGRSVGLKKGCQNFCRLEGDEDFFRTLALHYAEARHAGPAQVTELIIRARKKYLLQTLS